MAKYLFLTLLAVSAFCLYSENRPMGAGNPHDSMMSQKSDMQRQTMHAEMMTKMMEREGKGQAYENMPCDKICDMRMMGAERAPRWYGMSPAHHHMLKKGMIACFVGLLLLCAIINILLTILVVLDMIKFGRFNGLWVPLTLIIGVPATALYALFRIGDRFKAAE